MDDHDKWTVTVKDGKERLGTIRNGRLFLMDGTVTIARRNDDGTVTETFQK
jgi:hypothetical protein